MAKVNFNPWLENVRGAYGRLVFQTRYGKMIVARKAAASLLPPTADQTRQREFFTEASAYAAAVMKDATLRQPYVAAGKERNTNPYALAMADFLNLPVVKEVDHVNYHGKVGDPIRVRASDDFGLVSVTVRIKNEAGATLEEGPAANVAGVWTYHATTVAPTDQTLLVTATAKDRAHDQALDEPWHA